MNSIVVLTATYNHPEELAKLYRSLCGQNNKEFTWLVVNDGSEAETEEILRSFENDNKVDLYVITQKNGGKSSAINNGLNSLDQNVKFVVIVDDDECLYEDAITTILRYYKKYKDSNYGVIHFNRKNEKGEIIASPISKNDYIMSYQKFKSEGRYADGYLSYFTSHLKDERFTIFKDEKYIAPSTLFMKVSRDSDLLWASEALGETEYLAGGITKQGRKLRVKNPCGMIEYCELMQENGASLKTKLIYSIQGYAYASFAKTKYSAGKLLKIGLIPGKVLGEIWKRKYASVLTK